MSGGIYEIRNKVTGKYYVGRAKHFKTRFNRHRYELRHGRHHCLHLQRAWNKYGEANFEFVVVQECSSSQEAMHLEQARLNSRDPLMYNVSLDSTGGDLISQHPNRDSIVARMTQTQKQRYANMTLEERQRTFGLAGERNGMFGRRHSVQSKIKMSETALKNIKRGPEHPNFGLKRSDETRARISAIAAARTGEANSFHGKQHTPETRAAMSAKKKGKLPPNLRVVLAEGTKYPSVAEAARQLGVTPALIIYRIKSPKYNYVYKSTGKV